MARVAIIADIHGNLEALEAVLGDIDRQRNISKIYSLGDNVGYGPKPVEVLERLEGREIRSLIGNHEAAVMGILDFEERFSSENAVVINATNTKFQISFFCRRSILSSLRGKTC